MREIRQSGPHSFLYSPNQEPLARVAPKETVVVYTEDAFGGLITGPEVVPSEILPEQLNPQTGPIYVETAEPGDTLAVTIEALEPTRDWAVSAFIPHFGGLTSTSSTRTLQPALPERVYRYELNDGVYNWEDRFFIPWRPFLGTIGTAPRFESISALTPHAHGGNMDVRDACPGNTVFLPINVEGALFSTGDMHGCQGDGELCGVALEITGRATLTFDVIKNQTIAWPRIESPTQIMVIGSSRPMEDAARIAYAELVEWIAGDYDIDAFDAYQLLSQAGSMYVGNMVDPNYSMVAGIEKSFLTKLPAKRKS